MLHPQAINSRTYSPQKHLEMIPAHQLVAKSHDDALSTSWRPMVRRFVHVPRERALKHARRSRQDITYPPRHSAHFVRPEKRYFGRRAG